MHIVFLDPPLSFFFLLRLFLFPSLSLTYHTESLVGSGITTPPINYLQCPAAVTVHHLKRFVSAKYGINAERDVNIEIICEDEVLPEDFTLMDVAYCYNWTRVSVYILCI